MKGIKSFEMGNVKLSLYSYRSLHSDIIVEALQNAIPEANDFQNEIIIASWKWFLTSFSCLYDIEATGDLSDDESMLVEFWQQSKDWKSTGQWREIWNAYSVLSYDVQFVLSKAYTETRREAIGLSDPDIGGDDDKDPK